MKEKPTYEELENKVKELESLKNRCEAAEKELQKSREQYGMLSLSPGFYCPDIISDDGCSSFTENELLSSLKSSYAILNSILESPRNVIIFALDSEYKYLAFNTAHRRTMKQIWDADIAFGKSILDYIKNPDDRLKAKNNFDRVLSGESFTLEEEYGDKSLERRHYEDNYSPIMDENKRVAGITVFLMDVTERKTAQEALVKEKEKLQDAISKIKKLSGLLPICSHCKKIRDDKGYWNQIENFIHAHSEAEFSHSICPECARKYYPQLNLSEE